MTCWSQCIEWLKTPVMNNREGMGPVCALQQASCVAWGASLPPVCISSFYSPLANEESSKEGRTNTHKTLESWELGVFPPWILVFVFEHKRSWLLELVQFQTPNKNMPVVLIWFKVFNIVRSVLSRNLKEQLKVWALVWTGSLWAPRPPLGPVLGSWKSRQLWRNVWWTPSVCS